MTSETRYVPYDVETDQWECAVCSKRTPPGVEFFPYGFYLEQADRYQRFHEFNSAALCRLRCLELFVARRGMVDSEPYEADSEASGAQEEDQRGQEQGSGSSEDPEGAEKPPG